MNRAQNRLGRVGVQIGRSVWDSARKNASRDTRRSIGYRSIITTAIASLNPAAFTFSGSVEWVGSDVIEFVNKGRLPGSMPPVEPLIPWVNRRRLRGRRPGQTPRSIAWAVAKSIERDGIDPTPIIDSWMNGIIARAEEVMTEAFARGSAEELQQGIDELLPNREISL